MSEEQGKAARKWYKNWKSIGLILLVLCIIAFVIVLSAEPGYDGDGYPAYTIVRDDIKNAVAYYQTTNNGSLPILNGTYTNANCSNCDVINISALLTANGGMFREAPDGLNLSASGNDNCGGNASLGCTNECSYIWLVDTNGSVFSYCAGIECTTNNSGNQGVWP